MYIHICTHSGEVLCSTLPSNLLNEFLACNKECELKICPIHHVQKRQLANGNKMAFISPPNPRSPAMICPMASAAATILLARNVDNDWSKPYIVSLTAPPTCSNAAPNSQPLETSASV